MLVIEDPNSAAGKNMLARRGHLGPAFATKAPGTTRRKLSTALKKRSERRVASTCS